jgi:DNA-binding MarR family transcriptional regulator
MEKSELIDEIVTLQRQLNKILGPFAAKPWIDLGLTIAQLKSLFFIADQETTNFKKLAEALGVTPPNITGIVDRLVEQGLVTRNENPEDRRIMLLQATEKGKNLLDNLRETRTVRMAQILTHMSPEDLAMLLKGLKSFVKATEKYRKDAAG